MARGGYRPGAGRPKGSASGAVKVATVKAPKAPAAKKAGQVAIPAAAAEARKPDDIADQAYLVGMSPLEYMLFVMRDPGEEPNMRARMAVAAAPFMHPRAGEVKPGKKDARQDAAQKVSDGKFKPGAPPLRIVGSSK